jgi:uncharacterized protein (TIGR02246 family)
MFNVIKNAIKKVSVFLLVSTLAGLSFQTVTAAEAMKSSRADDYAAIQSLIMKYAHVYDSRDIEGYVSIFTDDAHFTFGGGEMNGSKEIREFITRVANGPAPTTITHHVITNTLIEFASDTEAHHKSYWEMVSGPQGGPFTVNGIGIYDDVVVKQNGEWRIKTRNIPN